MLRLFVLFLITLASSTANAAPILLSVSGQFSDIDTNPDIVPNDLIVPDGIFSLSFVFDSNPTPSDVTVGGFNAPFSNFQYFLNNVPVNVTPDFVRFWTTPTGGLFTVFFGPTSGFVNGVPIPVFEFSGPQLFTGPNSAPVFAPGTFQAAGLTYSDEDNIDFPTGPLTVQLTAIPEPSTFALAGIAFIVLIGVSGRLNRTARTSAR